MSQPEPAALRLSRRVLRALIVVNWVFGVLILALLVASLAAEQVVMTGLGAPPTPENAPLIRGMRGVMVLGLVTVPLAHLLLRHLLEIVETVRDGDPFVAANATRLQTAAFALLGMELIHIGVGLVAAMASSGPKALDLDWNFSVTGWLAVLLLFVLARVFDHGARMRDDLEGTV